ncbi:MAG TPA: glycosyltransferase family 2 protein, partial [Prochlorococcaceae cyanobacterium Fu_MAG_134]|nr:glycosyltransferase family 2 protein [Prochlorococcaceae cyanobacterium Fu_MAG_134]
MFVSVVIPTYNRRSILEKCLLALEQQALPSEVEAYEVIVVDDGSTDGTPTWLKDEVSRFPHVRMVEQEHGGPAEGRNRGVDHARG